MTWQQDLIKKAKKVIKHGWGEVTLKVSKHGKKYRTRVVLDDDYKDVKIGGTDPE